MTVRAQESPLIIDFLDRSQGNPNYGSNLLSMCNAFKTVEGVVGKAAEAAWLNTGLRQPFSPNHTEGLTTKQHVFLQLRMLEHLALGEFDQLANMVSNPNPSLLVSPKDLELVLSPLAERLSEEHWNLLALLVAFHDLGKLNRDWAREHLDTEGVEWIAHDYDSAILLDQNKHLLAPFDLDFGQKEVLKELCRLHSVPGQYFFGEGNVLAYQDLMEASPQFTVIGRIHGILDSMSALNEKFSKFVLNSHQQLSTLFDEAEKMSLRLESVNRKRARSQMESEVVQQIPVGPVSWQRLRRLLGNKVPPIELEEALETIPSELLEAFDRATDGGHTWYGTYIANAFGSGMIRALQREEYSKSVVVGNLIGLVACVAPEMEHRDQWAFGAVGPALRLKRLRTDKAREVLDVLAGLTTVSEGRAALSRSNCLKLRVGAYGVELY